MRNKFVYLVLILMLLVALAACGESPAKKVAEADKENAEEVKLEEEKDVEPEDEQEEEGSEEDSDSERDQTVSESNDVEKKNDTNVTSSDVKSQDKSSSSNQGNEEKNKNQEVIDLAYEIFDAQDKKDYSFLESIAAKGTKIDKENNQFIFEDVTYPFEMEFFTKDDLGELEHRYVHEKDTNNVIVGFGAINTGEQYSFVIDFEFVKEDGKWKMKSMDINK